MSMTRGLEGRWAAFTGSPEETEARLRVAYAAYDVPFGDASALARAQITKRPRPVPVRLPSGLLESFYPDLAVSAILHGGKLEI